MEQIQTNKTMDDLLPRRTASLMQQKPNLNADMQPADNMLSYQTGVTLPPLPPASSLTLGLTQRQCTSFPRGAECRQTLHHAERALPISPPTRPIRPVRLNPIILQPRGMVNINTETN